MNLILESRLDSYVQELKNKDIENAESIANSLFELNNLKKEKCFLWWILKKSVVWPEDEDNAERAFNIIEKQHLNFQDFERSMEVINRQESKKILAQDIKFDPSTEQAFSNPTNVGNGIIIYFVSDDKDGQVATRKAIDANCGYDKNPWCLAARDDNGNLDDSFKKREEYSNYPKRIAFKDGKLIAFSASASLIPELEWCDLNNKTTKTIPTFPPVEDDKEFIEKYI